ncbi:rab11 family-interacting protein 4B isoform X1 [Lucilia cuprina]|uniref:rab11 family-interacting protein 4B isoform X1 n=1 Tax=Lucilia cuprina TaxID=7375 RepID=UPI001F06E4CD|nr:rab11 family-interacting protein 4B isoform X1 [Lucilia cuprina]
MSSQPASQPDSIDLAYDMWAGQFEFVGPTTSTATNCSSSNTASNNQKKSLLNNTLKFGDRSASHKLSNESLEDLNLNFNNPTNNTQAYSLGCGSVGGGYETDYSKHPPILIDQETFLSLNPQDFDDIVPSGPNSLIFIDNKLVDTECNNNNHNKIINYESLTNKCNNKTNNTNTNGFKLENLKNFKNKLICDYEEKALSENNNNNNNSKMNGISLEMCENLNEQLELLQRQVTDLTDTKTTVEDLTSRTKTEYAVLQARYHMLEEQFREAEFRAEDRLAEEQKRHRELLARVEREAALQNENCQIKIKTIEIEANALREENQRLRVLCDKQANDLHRTEEKFELARDQIVALQQDLDEALQKERKYEKEKKTSEELMLELSKELERLRAETGPALPTTSPESIRLEELHQELEEMRQKNRALEEQNEELQAAVLTRGVEEGRHLLNGTLNSLAQELEEMSQAQDSVDSTTLASLSQLQQAFQEKEEENTRLKHYIDTILLNIVEKCPQLLEVKAINNK